jgi:hypothetical protein
MVVVDAKGSEPDLRFVRGSIRTSPRLGTLGERRSTCPPRLMSHVRGERIPTHALSC